MPSYTVSHQAYVKIVLHALKYPQSPVNGVLIGKLEGSSVFIVDSIPLLHHWTSLSPMMEIGLDMAGTFAKSSGMQLVGYYQACERIDDTSLAPVGEKVAFKVWENFHDAVAFVIDGDKLENSQPALVPYLPQSSGSTWRPHTSTPDAFAPGSDFSLANSASPSLVLGMVRDAHLHNKFGDFDDHLEDVSIDWLRNKDCVPDTA